MATFRDPPAESPPSPPSHPAEPPPDVDSSSSCLPTAADLDRCDPPVPAPPPLCRTESVGVGLPVGVENEAWDEDDDGSDHPSWQWHVPTAHVAAAGRGKMLESGEIYLRTLPFAIKLRLWPKGLSQARPGQCSTYMWTAEAGKLQVLLLVNEHSRIIDHSGPVAFRERSDRGYVNFCPSPVGDITVKVVLLRSEGFVPPNFNLPASYRVGKVLGVGAFGSVREAYDTVHDRQVAVKRMENVTDNIHDGVNILREMKLLSGLHHSHIVQIYDAFGLESQREALYIVMEYCDTDLKKVCSDLHGISLAQARRLTYNLLVGCNYLHDKGVYHRDLKPANCLAMRDCSVKICDFNLARTVDKSEDDDSAPPPPTPVRRLLTRHVVTRWYRPPEIILKLEYDEKIDVWSAGCILAELFGALNTNGRISQSGPLFRGSSCAGLSSDIKEHGDQMDKILDVLGTPTNGPEFFALPQTSKEYLRCYPPRTGCGLAKRLPEEASEVGINLLSQMIRFFPSLRVSMSEALHHPFFERVRRTDAEGRAAGEERLAIGIDAERDISSADALLQAFKTEFEKFEEDWGDAAEHAAVQTSDAADEGATRRW